MSLDYVKNAVKNGLKDYEHSFKDNNVMVAGGVFTSLFTRADVNDVDCYFRSKKDLVNFIYDVSENQYYPYFVNVTDKSLTLIANGAPTIQLIYFDFFEDLNAVFDAFDFTISMCGYDYKTDEMVYHKDFLSDLSQRRLTFNKKTAFPLVSALRVNKFTNRGFAISRGQMIKVMLAVSQLEINTPEEFVKHIGGMYGSAALNLLAETENFSVDAALEKLSELEGENTRNLLVAGAVPVTKTDKMPLNEMASILAGSNLLEGGWYRSIPASQYDASEAVYKDRHGRKKTLPLTVALMFAKDKERKPKSNDVKDGIFFKYVRPTDESGIYKSIYRDSFKYKLMQEVSDQHGMYLCTASNIKDHHFSSHEGTLILACRANVEDILKQSVGSNEFRATKLIPIAAFETTHDIEQMFSAVSPDVDALFGGVAIDNSVNVPDNEVKDSEEIAEMFNQPLSESEQVPTGRKIAKKTLGSPVEVTITDLSGNLITVDNISGNIFSNPFAR